MKLKVQQYTQPHPMSTICVSPCGTFCVAGNLKGDVISYDFRNMKQALYTKRVYDSAVVRVAFIPTISGVTNNTLEECTGSSLEVTNATSQQSSGRRSSVVCESDDSPYDNMTTSRRDSWSNLMPAKKFHDCSMDSVGETPTRPPMFGDNRSEPRSVPTIVVSQDDDMQELEIKEKNQYAKKEKPVIDLKRRRLTHSTHTPATLAEIEEEEESTTEVKSNNQNTSAPKKWLNTVDHKVFADMFAAYVQRIYVNGDGMECQGGVEEGLFYKRLLT